MKINIKRQKENLKILIDYLNF